MSFNSHHNPRVALGSPCAHKCNPLLAQWPLYQSSNWDCNRNGLYLLDTSTRASTCVQHNSGPFYIHTQRPTKMNTHTQGTHTRHTSLRVNHPLAQWPLYQSSNWDCNRTGLYLLDPGARASTCVQQNSSG